MTSTKWKVLDLFRQESLSPWCRSKITPAGVRASGPRTFGAGGKQNAFKVTLPFCRNERRESGHTGSRVLRRVPPSSVSRATSVQQYSTPGTR